MRHDSLRRSLFLIPLALLACQGSSGLDQGGTVDLVGSQPGGDASGGQTDLGDGGSATDLPGQAWTLPQCAASTTPVCTVTHELPIPTHYNATTKTRVFMASDAPVLTVDGTLPANYAAGNCYPLYQPGLMPSTDNYPADDYTAEGVSNEKATSFAQARCTASGVPLRHVFPPRADGTEVGAGPSSRSCTTQLVHAVTASDSLYTVILPPGWDAAAPAGTYPILFAGFYDLHGSVFSDLGAFMSDQVARTGLDGKRGVIGVIWNGGGGYASRTMTAHARDLAAQVIADVVARYRANAKWVVTYGGSRGGVTALTVAANLSSAPYRTVAAVAWVPPALIGEHAELGGVTFPALLHAVGWTTGLSDSWRRGWTYPACAGRAELTGLSGWQAHLKILTGTSDPAVANAQFSLASPAQLDALESRGTQLALTISEHDYIVPYAHQVRLGGAIFERGMPAQIDILVRGGHAGISTRAGGAAQPYAVHERALARIIDALAAPTLDLSGAVPTLVDKGVRFFRVNRVSGEDELFTPASYPFAVDIPRYGVLGGRFPLVVVGEPGTSFAVIVDRDATGQEAARWTGTIPANRTTTHWVDVPVDFPTGTYTWRAELSRGGQNVSVPSTATTTGAACVTDIIAEEPVLSSAEVATAALGPTLPHHPTTTWGLSEY